jgi:hypothetical protein
MTFDGPVNGHMTLICMSVCLFDGVYKGKHLINQWEKFNWQFEKGTGSIETGSGKTRVWQYHFLNEMAVLEKKEVAVISTETWQYKIKRKQQLI